MLFCCEHVLKPNSAPAFSAILIRRICNQVHPRQGRLGEASLPKTLKYGYRIVDVLAIPDKR